MALASPLQLQQRQLHAVASPCSYQCATPKTRLPRPPCITQRQTWRLQAAAVVGPGQQHAPVLVVGAGIAGLAVAVALSKVGLPVRVLEAGPGLRQEGSAIGLWANAWRALDALGVADSLRPAHLRLDRVELCRDSGQLLRAFAFSECSAARVEPQGVSSEFRGVRRVALLQALYDSLPDPQQTVQFGAAVSSVLTPGQGEAKGEEGVVVRLQSGEEVRGSVLVGADGVRSAVADYLQLPAARYSGYVAYRGVAEMSAVPVPLDTIRQIWGAGVRAGLYPLSSSTCYWYTCFNASEGEAVPVASAEARQRAAAAAVRGWSWNMEEVVMSTPPSDITYSRIVDRWTAGSYGRGRVTLAGDAAHPMTPNLGQGGCTALEDAVVLARSLAQAAQGALHGL